MTTLELLQTLKSKNIKLWSEDGKLKFRAPEGMMTPENHSKFKSEQS